MAAERALLARVDVAIQGDEDNGEGLIIETEEEEEEEEEEAVETKSYTSRTKKKKKVSKRKVKTIKSPQLPPPLSSSASFISAATPTADATTKKKKKKRVKLKATKVKAVKAKPARKKKKRITATLLRTPPVSRTVAATELDIILPHPETEDEHLNMGNDVGLDIMKEYIQRIDRRLYEKYGTPPRNTKSKYTGKH